MLHKVYRMLGKIPRRKVATYGSLARACGTSPRAVGALMRSNRHPEMCPCYKVVKSTGEIGGYGGCIKGAKLRKKVSLLRKDGVKVAGGRIDLEKFAHKF